MSSHGQSTLLVKSKLGNKRLKGTVRRYGSRSITHDFTGSEIITKTKVYVVLQYLCKEDSQDCTGIHVAKLEDHKVGSSVNKCICAI